MKRYLFYQTIFFLTISALGVALSFYFMQSALRSLAEIQLASTSMARRSALYREIEKIEKDRGYLSRGLIKIERMLKTCNRCHGPAKHKQGINKLQITLNLLKSKYIQGESIEQALEQLHDLANHAALKGEEHILKEVAEITSNVKTWGILSGIILLILFLGLCFIAITLQKRASKYINQLVEATEGISQGRQITLEAFRDEFKPVGEALQRMQAHIAASEEKLLNWAKAWEKTFDAIEEMICVCDSNAIVIQANRAFKRTFGRDSEGKPLNFLLSTKLKVDLSQQIARTLSLTERPIGEMRSEEGYFRWSIYPIRGLKDDVTGFIWICRDATREKELEERALQAEKLVALGELVAGIAHELNNPLSVVVGYSEILSTMALPDNVKKKARRIFESAERAAGIVKSLLDISRKRPFKTEYTKIEPLIKNILELMEYELKSDGIEVETEFGDTPAIEVDPVHIKQIAINLLKNAHDAVLAREQGRKIWIKTFVDKDYICFQVRDNGPGIPENIKHRIFEPFFTTKDVGKGTGLGLYSVYNLVLVYNGDVAASNHPDGGAVFTVKLPLKAPSLQAESS